MKTRFSSNSQLCHIWAQQNQSKGRANNMFFIDNKIYSYGFHYLAAMIHEVKGRKICLINSDSYSQSTSKHLSKIASAVRDNMEYFYVPDVEDIYSIENENYFVDQVVNCLDRNFKTVKVTRFDDQMRKWVLEGIDHDANEANKFLELAGKKPIEIDPLILESILAHLKHRYERYLELKAPEEREKREKKREKELEKVIEKYQQYKNEFIEGKIHSIPKNAKIKFDVDFFQVRGDRILTQRGAEVKVSMVLKLINRILDGKKVEGLEVGSFTVDRVDGDIIKIGCHKFSIEESMRILNIRRQEQKSPLL